MYMYVCMYVCIYILYIFSVAYQYELLILSIFELKISLSKLLTPKPYFPFLLTFLF